jgi:hypothetical protein
MLPASEECEYYYYCCCVAGVTSNQPQLAHMWPTWNAAVVTLPDMTVRSDVTSDAIMCCGLTSRLVQLNMTHSG